MMKYLLFALGLCLCCTGCMDAEPPNKIFITGDYSGSLDYLWSEERNGNIPQMRAASYPDSASITYPAFYFVISSERAILYVRTEENKALDYYYAVNPSFEYAPNRLQLKDLKMIFGTGLINNEIQNPDDSRSVLLNGKLKRP